jgi:hypothetical protein
MEFLVELYVSRNDAGTVDQWVDRARLAADELTREGTLVSCLRSIFVPEDETCYLLFEASSADDVRSATTRAALAFERIAEAR